MADAFPTASPRAVRAETARQHRAAVRRMPPAQRTARRVKIALLTAVIVVAVLFVAFPVWFVVVAAFGSSSALGTEGVVPKEITTVNFQALTGNDAFPYFTWLGNSLRISVLVSVLSVLFTAMSAYAFSRFRFRGRRTLMKAIVVIEVFPNLLALVAIFLLVQQVGRLTPVLGLDSTWALALVYLGGILGGNVWLMKGYLDSIPKELDESAAIDGASRFVIFWRVLLPLMRPMLAVVAVLVFVATYGELLLARVLLKSSEQLTLPVGLFTFVSGQYGENWGPFAAGALIAAIPPIVLFYLLQDWLIGGLTQGAVKS